MISYKWVQECCNIGKLLDTENHRIRMVGGFIGVPDGMNSVPMMTDYNQFMGIKFITVLLLTYKPHTIFFSVFDGSSILIILLNRGGIDGVRFTVSQVQFQGCPEGSIHSF